MCVRRQVRGYSVASADELRLILHPILRCDTQTIVDYEYYL